MANDQKAFLLRRADELVAYAAGFRGQEGSETLIEETMARVKGLSFAASELDKMPASTPAKPVGELVEKLNEWADVLDIPSGDFVNEDLRAAASALTTLAAERDALHGAMTKISAIRDSIIGTQTMNWSEHIYPLVAALGEAGFEGAGYEISRKNMGTLIDQIKAAEESLTASQAQVATLTAALDGLTEFVWRWTWYKDGNGTTDAERLDVLKHYPPIAALNPKPSEAGDKPA